MPDADQCGTWPQGSAGMSKATEVAFAYDALAGATLVNVRVDVPFIPDPHPVGAEAINKTLSQRGRVGRASVLHWHLLPVKIRYRKCQSHSQPRQGQIGELRDIPRRTLFLFPLFLPVKTMPRRPLGVEKPCQ
jgi:hypothetical protein